MQVKTRNLTLQQHAVLAGFSKQRDIVAALEARGIPRVPQSVISQMFRGNVAYPKAREALVRLFWPEEWAEGGAPRQKVEQLLVQLIRNSVPGA